jgi:pyrroline-5-carboxylate reductase
VVGRVLQAALRRPKADPRALAAPGVRVRLVQGVYAEPGAVAFAVRPDVDKSYALPLPAFAKVEIVIAILGTGKMGEALLSGLLRAGRSPAEVAAVVRRPARADELRAAYGIPVLEAAEAAQKADTLVIAVKPQDMGRTLDEIAGLVTSSQLVISIAAGITTSFIEARFPVEVPVVRVMPNTPALVDEAMSVISAGSFAGEEHLRQAEELLTPVGKVIRIPEYQQDAATALSGSGPAYVFYLVEAMVDAGLLLGLPRSTALEMVTQTVYGAATMLRDSGEHPVILRDAVTSPAGTTIAAIRELEKHGVRAAFLAAIEAARDRGRELGGS